MWLLVAFKYAFCVYLAVSAVYIFASWKKKLRLMLVLYGRNKAVFRPDTLKPHIRTLCGKLMVGWVLMQLRKTSRYRDLANETWSAYKNKVFKGV
jgi:hypothetical protein